MNFTVYSKTGCPYCDKVKQVLELTKLQHVVYTLDKDFTREGFCAEFGEGSTFPQNTIGMLELGLICKTTNSIVLYSYIIKDICPN